MRQVFTIPYMKNSTPNKLLVIAPKFVCFLPTIVFFIGVVYDYYSILKFGLFSLSEVSSPLIFETIWLPCIVILSWKCWKGQNRIDRIWKENWEKIKNKGSSEISATVQPAPNKALDRSRRSKFDIIL
jgi:hypothetical protein